LRVEIDHALAEADTALARYRVGRADAERFGQELAARARGDGQWRQSYEVVYAQYRSYWQTRAPGAKS